MCYLELIRDTETFKRYPPDGFLTTEQSDHDVDLDPDIIDPDPFASDDRLNVFSPVHHLLLKKTEERNIMNVGEDEQSSGLNGRLRPRKSTAHSSQIKDARKSDGRYFREKSKRNSTQSKVSPNKPDDLPEKSDSSPVLYFLCPYCDKKFVSKQTVSKHSRRMHLSTTKQDTFIRCLFCNHTEFEPNDIIRHMVDSHPNQYFACFNCHTRFSSTSELAEHKLNVCEKPKPSYRSKLRQKTSNVKKIAKKFQFNCKSGFRSNCKEYPTESGYNGIVISCELKPSQVHDAADIEDNITTNLILPPNKNISSNSLLEKNAVIVLDDIQWNKRLPPNFTFHNTDADQILSRLGVIHRTPRTGEGTRRDWLKTAEDSTQKFEKCFDTSFYAQVASNVQENLTKFLDGSFNFNPGAESAIKTRKAKNSVAINTVEGFPILLNCKQYSRNVFDSILPRTISPKHKCKWGSLDNDKTLINPDQLRRDTHTNNCIITLVSSLDIWTQLCMRRKYENKFSHSPVEKKVEKRNLIDKELKEILESRELPVTSSQVVKYIEKPVLSGVSLDFPSSLGLTPSAPQYQLQPAVLSGEWVRPRCYVCCACGAQTRDSRALTSHISTQHPNAQVQHYEIVGESLLNADILKHLYVPPSQPPCRTRPLRGFKECTKCKISASLEDLHQHMLDCAGDTPTVRRKCRYRPFGVRRRRPRLPDNTIRKKIRKDIRNRQNQKAYMRSRARPRIKTEVGDAETIRKMLADLPAKRHRVMINPVNSMLRPRRKFDMQRNSLLIKRHPSDDPKNRKLCSKEINNSKNNGEPTQKKNTSKENNKPMRAKIKHIAKSGRQNESFKRSTVFKRPKRSLKKTNIVEEENDPGESTNDDPSDGLLLPERKESGGLRKQEASDSPQKIDINEGPYKIREQSGGNEGTNSGGSGSYSKESESDPGGGGDNPGGEGPNRNGDRSNNNNGRPSDGRGNNDKHPVQNTPLKHSIARLTANSETHDKSVQFHHLFLVQQECNNLTEHAPTGQRELFENEAVVTKLDKPPLHYPKGALDPYSLQKSKLNKPRKGLNDCIAMLKNKLVDPPSRPVIDQVSVQCGDDEPIEPIHYGPRTILESGINMTPAEIFYRPIVTQGAVLPNRGNLHNLVSFAYPTAQAMNAATHADKPKVKQKRYSHSSDRKLPKQKQNDCLTKRKSTRINALTRNEIKAQHEAMRLPPQIEIISRRPENVQNMKSTNIRFHDPYKNTEPVVTLNRQISNDLNNQKRRASSDAKVQYKETKKNSVIVSSEPGVTFDNQCQNKWSKEQIIECKSPECQNKNQLTNQMQLIATETTTRKPLNSNDNIYSESNYNDVSSDIPLAHSSTAVDSVLSTPLDLSGKSVSMNQVEKTLQEDDIYYHTNYDSYGTLDLSNKKSDYLTSTREDTVTDIVVDLSVKSVQQSIPKATNCNIYCNSSIDTSDIVTDLSTSIRDTDNYPRDLSMRVNDINSRHENLENFTYEVQNLSGCNTSSVSEKGLPYSSDANDFDTDIPTDLSGKTKKGISDSSQFLSISQENDVELRESLDLSKNSDLPADLSTKSNNENHTILPAVYNAVVPSNFMESPSDANLISSSSPVVDTLEEIQVVFQEIPPQPNYDNFVNIPLYKMRDNLATTEATVLIEGNLETNLHSSMSCSVQIVPINSYNTNFNCSNIELQQIHTSSHLNLSSQDRTPSTPVNVTTCVVRGEIPLYTLPDPIQGNPFGKYESTKPVYTLANACKSISKIETSNSTTLTNTLLSVPEPTVANTTPVYTLAGTSIDAAMTYEKNPHMVNEIKHTMSNINICHSSVSPSHEVNKTIDQYSLSTEVITEFDKGVKNIYSSIAADLDPDAVSKIARLPKEIVEILGTMPIDHRKQLLNILPHYVTTSTSGLSLQDKNSSTKTHESVLQNAVSGKKSPYLQVQTADSTSGTKNCNNMKVEDDCYQDNLHKCHNLKEADIKLIPLPPSPPPPLHYETMSNDTAKIIQSEQLNLYDSTTKENDCCDIKTIDLTQDDNVDVLVHTINEVDETDRTISVTASEIKESVISKGNKLKVNDQTASLRAVRIRTPSERLKVVSTERQILLKNQIEATTQKTSVEENKGDLTIKTAGVNIKVTGESHSTVISQVDFESNNKKLKDESNKKSSEYITIKIDVDQDSQNEHVNNPTRVITNDINCTNSNKTHMSLDIGNENTKNSSQTEINGVNSNKNKSNDHNDTEQNSDRDISILMSTNKKDICKENEHTWLNTSIDNEKEMSDEDDSEDDILLAVIVKQKREKQIISKFEKEIINHDSYDSNKQVKKLVATPTSCNELKLQTKEQHISNTTPIITVCKSNEKVASIESEVLEREHSVDMRGATSNNDLMKIFENVEQKIIKRVISVPASDIESMVHHIEKVDMGVQYECISKEFCNESDTVLVTTSKYICNDKYADEKIVEKNTNQRFTTSNNTQAESESHMSNIKHIHSIQDISCKIINGNDACSENLKTTSQFSFNENKEDDVEHLEITPKNGKEEDSVVVNNAHYKPKTTTNPEQTVKDCREFDDNMQFKNIKEVVCNKQSINIDKEKTTFAIELSLGSNVEEGAQIPLRRSRRGKSMFVNRNVSTAYDDNASHTEISLEQKTPLTKKQLIFSKLLLHGENHSNIPAHSTPEKDFDHQECRGNIPENMIHNLSSVESSTSEVVVNKSKKRTKSSQVRQINKKKKMLETMDVSDTDNCQEFTKIPKTKSNYGNNTVATEKNITAHRKVKSICNEKICDQQIDSSVVVESSSQPTILTNTTTIGCTPILPISSVGCNNNYDESTSTEKRKLILPTTSSDLALYSNQKKAKADINNETVTSTFIKHNDNSKDIRFEHENNTFINAKSRTTCYSRPVPSKRTRSKSVIVKSSEKDSIYDPYNIDHDDMIAKTELVERKRLKIDKMIPSNRVHKLIDLPSTSNSKEIKKREASPVIRRKVKKSIKQRDRLRREKRIKDNTSDSDESSRSDVPLTKYVKDRKKKMKRTYDDVSDRDDYDIDPSDDDTSSDKQGARDCRNTKRTLTNCNNDISSSHDETEERLKSEQFMESFGFFSERKPRKSNLLAAKKISETFHIIANESDDAYVGYRERAIKRALQNENKKAKEGECSRAQVTARVRKTVRRGVRKKKICARLLRCFCKLCKKQFRRPDNYLRHQLTLLHISRLSEELKIKITPFLEEPNYLIVYKQHIDRLKIITDKLAKKKKTSKAMSKITLPTLTEILVEVNRVVREQLLTRRGLSRDEALFLDCCELLKESHMNDGDPNNIMNSNYRCPQATMSGLALIEKQIDEDKSDGKSDGEVDSITAKNILESEEVRNLENDLISGLKEAANVNNAHNKNFLSYQNADDNARMDSNDTVNETFPNTSQFGQTANKFDNIKEPTTSKVKKPEVKRMMYPDIIEDIDMYEDKFDKIKRKCRSQAAAAKQIQNVVESNASQNARKKNDKKKGKKKSKKKHQNTQVPTKGALKGFDGVKVPVPQSEPNKNISSHERSKKKRKKSASKKKKDKKVSECNKNEIDNLAKDTTEAHKKVDVYEFMDSEDAELFEFRPSTLMERFKSINNKAVPSTSKASPIDDADNSSDSASDGDDFVYISDDYVGSDNETENSMSCDMVNAKMTNEAKKTMSPLKRKDTVEKNAVMGKIFKHNAVRTEKKLTKYKEISKPKANMDQLFDSLLEDEPGPSENPKLSKPSEHCPRNMTTTPIEDTSLSSPKNVLSPTTEPKHYDSPKSFDSSLKKCNDYIDYTPSTSKKVDEFFKADYNTESKKHSIKTKNYKELSPKKNVDATEFNKQDNINSISQTLSKYDESSPKSDYPSIHLNSKEKYKTKSPSKKIDEGIGTSYDYSAELFDQNSYDDMGVARQRARRKCTVGKQKVLAETWSSESEPDEVPPRANSVESRKSDGARKKRGRKKEGQHQSSVRRGSNRTVTFKKQDEIRVTGNQHNHLSGECESCGDGGPNQSGQNTSIGHSGTKWKDDYHTRDEVPSCSNAGPNKLYTPIALSSSPGPSSGKVRPRPSLYYWSSDGDDEQEHPQQHGWIVGDSHKKLVTMLAHAKGRKRNNNDEKRHLVE